MLSLRIRQASLLKGARSRQRHESTIVSLTTIPGRVSQLRYTLLSITNGEALPQRVVVYASAHTLGLLDAAEDSVVRSLRASGLLVLEAVDDVGPHTKLVYALRQFPDCSVVVCDDDIIYPQNWLSTLLDRYEEVHDQKTIICHRAHLVIKDGAGKIEPYVKWPKELASRSGELINPAYFPTGTGGILFPAGSMPPLTWDESSFRKLTPTADDIWFYFCALLNGNRISLTRSTYSKVEAPEIPNYSAPNLYYENVEGGANDKQFADCVDHFASTYNYTL